MRSRSKGAYESVFRLNHKDSRKGKTLFLEGVGKIMNAKMGVIKSRKLSMYESLRSTPKQTRHKKDISTVK